MPQLLWNWKRERKTGQLLPGEYAGTMWSLKQDGDNNVGDTIGKAVGNFFQAALDASPGARHPREWERLPKDESL